MGNFCGQLKTTSSMEWGGEDWGSLTSKHKRKKVFDQSDLDQLSSWEFEAERERLLGALKASSDENGKLKIRISKKELEDLMAAKPKIEKQQQRKQKAEQGVSVELLLLRLINASDHADEHHSHPRPWTPVLQSIPEVN